MVLLGSRTFTLVLIIDLLMPEMQKTTFKISKMDCPSEENLIRMKLNTISGIHRLEFDISARKLTIFHHENVSSIEMALEELDLGSETLLTESVEVDSIEKSTVQRKLLWTVLIINFVFFIVEMVSGIISKSMGLVADSLDMLADAVVYGMSLMVVGGSILRKKRVAAWAGYLQIILASIGFLEILRRFFYGEALPDFIIMIIVSIVALTVNGFSLYTLQKSTSNEAHMKASIIFTSNDVIVNAGVIIAGIIVGLTGSAIPDLIVGTIVFGIVIRGAIRILKLAK